MENFDTIWEELNTADFEYNKDIYGEDEELAEDLLLEMANMTGRKVKTDEINFSFYFSRKNASRHGIRLKVFWDKQYINDDKSGYIELHGNYEYSQDPKQKYKPKSYMIDTLRYFARKYKVLFAAVWENVLGEDSLQDYFRGIADFKQLLSEFNANKIGKQKYEALNYAKDLQQLERTVRKYSIYNMND